MRYLPTVVFIFSIIAGTIIPAKSQVLTSQPHIGVEQVPIGDDVYAFLRHLSVRGAITGFSEAQLPISEFEVVGFLHQAESQTLSSAERELVLKYLQTYAHEPREAVTMFSSDSAKPLFFDGIFTQQDKYLYRWFNDSTKSDLFVDGIGSVEYRRQTDPSSESVKLLNLGGRFSGTLSGSVGYFMQTTNGVALGDKQLALEDPALSRNNNLLYYTNFFDFTTAELAYTNDWFTGKLAREAIAVGGGYQDNILLSAAENVPTYDFISLGAHVGTVRYQSIFASLVPDSVTDQFPYQTKYLAVHDLTMGVGRNGELGFTEIEVITRPDLAYLNPFSFLETVKHALDGTQDQNLGILGTHARWDIVPGIEVRGQAFIQDLVINKIGTGYWSNKGGDQLGIMWAGAFGIPNLDWEAEWTRILPYTYSHWDSVGSYSNSGTPLGDQIGPNSISYWTKLRWAPDPKWIIALQGQFIERGENIYDSSGNILYNAGSDYRVSFSGISNSSENQTFILNGRRVDILNLTLDIEFEPWRGLTFYFEGTKTFVDYLKEPLVTPGFNLTGLPVSLAPQALPSTIGAFGIKAFF